MKMTATVSGLQKLHARYSNRANFLGSDKLTVLCEGFGKAAVYEMRATIASFTPGSVEDLTEQYKKQKARKWGHVYPILIASGELFNSIYSKVRREAQAFIISIGFRGTRSNGISNERLAEIHTQGSPGRGGRVSFAKANLKSARTAKRLLSTKGTRASVRSAREALEGAHRGLPARDFTKLPRSMENEWLTKISEALRSLR